MPSYAPSVLSYAFYALLLITVVLFAPHGLLPTIRSWLRAHPPARLRHSLVTRWRSL
jgi:branched-chain amino acid transport system permease protein